MAKEKNRRELMDRAINLEKEILGRVVKEGEGATVEIKVPPSAKYKKRDKKDKDQPDLFCGQKLVIAVKKKGNHMELQGYLLGIVLDYEHDDFRWSKGTDIIVQIVKSSIESLDDYIGRLINVRYTDHDYYYGRFCAVSFDPSQFKFDR